MTTLEYLRNTSRKSNPSHTYRVADRHWI